ncbi:MAG TPA: hypothetical protein VGI17_05310 [Solirubrobacterales bacterium]|jgi:hypothetical protein
MKWLKSGPELKLPDFRSIRVPSFVEDLYYDLKERRLLPLVALGIVAIIAVPFLLSGGSDKPEATAPVPRGGTVTASDARGSLTVVRANPGLRDYRKRLHRKAADPFKQHFTAPQLAGTKLGTGENESPTVSGSTTSSSTSRRIESTQSSVTTKTIRESNGTVTGESETTTPKPQGQPGSGTSEGRTEGNTGTEGGESRWFAFAIDVQVKTAVTLPDGTVETGEPVTLSELHAPAPIPTEKTPVVAYIGANFKSGKFVLMVSEEVTSIFGEGKCVMGTQTCQLLEIETGMPETFVYGPSAERFKITITNVKRVPIELTKNLEETAKSP